MYIHVHVAIAETVYNSGYRLLMGNGVRFNESDESIAETAYNSGYRLLMGNGVRFNEEMSQ